MRKVARFFIRISSFFRKEVVNLLRQPRLMATLVAGPFLILLLFGVGYSNEAPTIRTRFVIDEESPMRPYVAQYMADLGPQLIYSGMTSSEAAALSDLQRGEVDAVAIVPDHAMADFQQGQSVAIEVLHNQIMPRRANYIDFTMGFYIHAFNRRVMTDLLEEEQSQIPTVQADVANTKQTLQQIQAQITQPDVLQTLNAASELAQRLDELDLAMGAITDTLATMDQVLPREEQLWLRDVVKLAVALNQDLQLLEATGQVISTSQLATISDTIATLNRVQTVLTTTQALDPTVVVSPFDVQVRNINAVSFEMIDFYTPGVLALLLQHLSITFAALSIVQEERLGALEIFQIAPLSPFEALVGKYLSYLLFNTIIAGLLTTLVIYGLGVPMLGAWLDYAITLLGVVFTSLGIGFLISLLTRTTSQAVQASMMLLLSSVFFTGFFESLDFIKRWLRVLSWSLPTTYGIQHLQDIMLRGRVPDWNRFLALVGIGTLLFGVNLVLLTRKLLPHRN